MAKIKEIKNWRLKEKFLKENGGENVLLLGCLNGDLNSFASVNQAVGAIINADCGTYLQILFATYTSYGIWLAENNGIEINFKPKPGELGEPKVPGYTG